MSNETTPDSNAERLLTHLKPDSLAARIVAIYAAADNEGRKAAIDKLVQDRLAEIAQGYNEDQ